MAVRGIPHRYVLLGLAVLAAGHAHAAAPIPLRATKHKKTNIAFVLLPEARLPKADAVAWAFATFSLNHESIRERPPEKGAKPGGGEALVFDLGPHGSVLIGLMPNPVPKGEADEAARYSVSAGEGKLPRHKAHLIVAQNDDDVATVDALSRFTAILAALTEASGAIGVYWGNAGATHDAKFFLGIARDKALISRLMLWTGVSVARGADGRVSLLSLGMGQLELPDLLLTSSPALPKGKALEFFFSLLAMVAEGGKALPEGDTVGRDEHERLPVHYVPSPVDAGKKVWRVDLK